jgi:hypothetical protein
MLHCHATDTVNDSPTPPPYFCCFHPCLQATEALADSQKAAAEMMSLEVRQQECPNMA